MWNPFKKNIEINNKKSVSQYSKWPWLINTNDSGGNNSVTIKRSLEFYDNAAPVATAIDWINDEFKTLCLQLQNGDNVENESKILRFLKSPNDDMTQEDFLENIGAYFLITNECYLIATGRPDREPSEVIIVSPQYVTVRKGKDGFVNQMRVQIDGLAQQIFSRDNDSYRFYTQDGLAEIWQIKGFSAVSDSVYGTGIEGGSNLGNARGRSKLSSIHREINQYIEVAASNLGTLKNGMKPSGTLTLPEGVTLDEEQFERLKKQVEDFYAGGENSGKVLILDNGIVFTPASVTPKDMDFEKLGKSVTITIFNRYKVPLPLISPDNMTLANMETAKLNLYDNCVIPMANRLFRELTNFLAPRFNLTEDMLIIPNIGKIQALQIRHFEQLKLKKELEVYTKNELREEVGKEGVKGGDTLYISNTMRDIASELIENQQPVNSNVSNEQVKTTRVEFVKLMQAQVDKKGNRILDDNEIEEIADKEGL